MSLPGCNHSHHECHQPDGCSGVAHCFPLPLIVSPLALACSLAPHDTPKSKNGPHIPPLCPSSSALQKPFFHPTPPPSNPTPPPLILCLLVLLFCLSMLLGNCRNCTLAHATALAWRGSVSHRVANSSSLAARRVRSAAGRPTLA